MRDDELIGSKSFTAASISSLGYVTFNTSVADGKDTSVTLRENVNTYATQQLTRDLLSEATFEIYRAADLANDPDRASPVQRHTLKRSTSPAAFEQMLTGGQLDPRVPYDIPLTGLDTKTEYKIKIKAKIAIVDDEYELPTQNDLDTFTTKRKAPVARIKAGDLMATTDTIYIFDARMDDPDGAILSTVSMVVRNSKGIPVFADTLQPNTDYDYVIRQLDTDVEYTIVFTAAEYNDAFDSNDYTSYKTGVRLRTLPQDENPLSQKESLSSAFEDCYKIITTDTISGRLTLRGMDKIAGNDDELNVKMRAEIRDTGQNLKNEPRYKIKIYSRPGYGEYSLLSDGEKVFDFNYGDLVNHVLKSDSVITLKKYFEVRAELWVKIGDRELMLDQVFFDTDGPMMTISKTYQLRWLNGVQAPDDDGVMYSPGAEGRYGRYLVTEDLRHFVGGSTPTTGDLIAGWANTGVNSNDPNSGGSGSNSGPFQGLIDFQGHALDFTIHTGSVANPASTLRRFIYSMGYQGVLRNAVINYNVTGENPLNDRSPIYSNSGHIMNVQLHTDMSATETSPGGIAPYYHSTFGLLAQYNSAGGVIENFTVDLGKGVYARANFGGLVYQNAGIIRNGYAYGTMDDDPDRRGRITTPIVPGAANTAFTAQNIGGVVGLNTSTGRVSNVYSLVDIYVNIYGTNNRTVNPNRYGSVVGFNNNGNIKRNYTTGEVYFNTVADPDFKPGIQPNNPAQNLYYGPGVGAQDAAARTESYYVASDPNRLYNNDYNSRITRDTLHDEIWQRNILGSPFESVKTIQAGFFPQLVLPYGMPKQPFIPLPEISALGDVELSSVFVEEQMEDYAIALLKFKNKNYYQITGLTVLGLKAEVIPGSQIDADEVSRVQVKLSDPSVFKSSYQISQFSYRPLNVFIDYPASTSMTVNAEFYKPVRDAKDWKEINLDRTANYRLMNDIDLSSLAPSELMIGTTISSSLNANVFRGRIDGGYYNSKYELQGMHKITGITMASTAGTNYWGVISTLWGGTVSNLIVEDMKVALPNNDYAGFVGYTYGGAKIDNVHILGGEVSSKYNAGGLAAIQYFCDISNCSATDLRLTDGNGLDFRAGGISGHMSNASTLYNSYVYGLNLTENRGENMRGVGGVIGAFDGGETANVYAQGKINVRSIDSNIGGIVGYRAGNDRILENCWSDVDIRTRKDDAGGIIGSNSTVTDFNSLNALAIGDVASSLAYVADDLNRPVRRVVGTCGGNQETTGYNGPVSGAFAYTGQYINNLPYDDAWVDDPSVPRGPGRDGATMATDDDLRSRQYYVMRIHMGNEFAYDGNEFAAELPGYGGVAEGYLPLLRHTEGGLLPFQTPHMIGGRDYTFDIQEATIDPYLNYVVTMTVTHAKGVKIDHLIVEDINIPAAELSQAYQITPMPNSDERKTQIIFTFKNSHIQRYVDTYAITGVVQEGYPDGKYDEASAQIAFGPLDVPYLKISNAAEWAEQMTPEKHGQSTENIRIVNDIDFSSFSSGQLANAINVKVNRLSGLKPDASTPVIKGLDLQFAATNMGFVKSVNSLLENLDFRDISLTQTIAGGTGSESMGIISQATGTVYKLRFSDIVIQANGAQRVGMIGYLRGNVKDVVLKDINVNAMRTSTQNLYANTPYARTVHTQSGAAYVGGLLGYGIDSVIDNVTLTTDQDPATLPGENDVNLDGNPNIVRGLTYIGGVAGYVTTTRISNCSVDYLSVYSENFNTGAKAYATTNSTHIGGVAGVAYTTGNEPRNEHHTVRHVRVVTEGNYAGGVFGTGMSYSVMDAPTTVEDTVVIAAGDYGGGISGAYYTTNTQNYVNRVKVFARRYVGGNNGGNGESTLESYIRDSVISTIYDPQYDEVKATSDGKSFPDVSRLMEATVKSLYNSHIGGIAGQGRSYDSVVVNCTVGAVDAVYVGGAVGHSTGSSAQLRNEVMDTMVYGRDYIGGIIGYKERAGIYNNVTNAEIEGTGSYVGGIVGYIKPEQSLYGDGLAHTYENIFTGRVRGGNYVGGIVGRVEGNLYPIRQNRTYYYRDNTTNRSIAQNMTLDRDNHMIGKVCATGLNSAGQPVSPVYASLLYNLDPTITIDRIEPTGNRIWEYSVLQIGATAEYAKDLKQSDGVTPLFKYGDRDGGIGGAAVLGPDEEALYSGSDLLLTRDHYAMSYNANVMSELSIVPLRTAMDTEAETGNHYCMRQVWHQGGTDTSIYWFSGFRAGYLPYATTTTRYYYNDKGQQTAPRTQALFTEGKDIGGNYNPTAESPMFSYAWPAGVDAYGVEFHYNTDTGSRRDKLFSNAVQVDNNYSGGIPIPVDPGPVAAFGLSETVIPEAEVYASGADKLNIEFASYTPGDYFLVSDASGSEAFVTATAIDRSVYTLDYDYKTPLLVVTGNKFGENHLDFDPDTARRTVMVYGDDYYYIAPGGLYSGKSGDAPLMEKAFVNLKDGYGLTKEGEVYDLAAAAALRSVDKPASLSEDVAPLFSFEANGETLSVFKNFTRTGGGAEQRLRLLVKNGALAAVDPSLPVVSDAVILDMAKDDSDADGTRDIMTVLGDDGVIADAREPITLPEDLETEGVAEMTNTLNTDLNVCIVRYETGRTVAFDYLTGETIKLSQSRGGVGGIVDYARSLLQSKKVSLLAGLSSDYREVADYTGLIAIGAITDAAILAGEDAEEPEDTSDDAAQPGDEEAADYGSGPAPEKTGAAVDGKEAVDAAPAGVGAEEGKTAAAGTPGDDKDGEPAGAQASADKPKDLARPEAPKKLVSVYRYDEGVYEIYDAGALLTADAAKPLSTFDFADSAQAALVSSLKAHGHDDPVNRGLLIMVLSFASIAVLLLYIYRRRRRLTKSEESDE
jgi:hypothetical protein